MESNSSSQADSKTKKGAVYAALIFAAGPFISYAFVEIMECNNPFLLLNAEAILLNFGLYISLFLTVWLISGKIRFSCRASSGFCFAWGVANHYVYIFRGRAIFPCDLLSLRTAGNVAGGYNYAPDSYLISGIVIFIAYMVLTHFIPKERKRTFPGWKLFTVCAASAAAFLFVFFGTNFLQDTEIYVQQWNTTQNGFFLNFAAAVRYSFVTAPDGYSSEAAAQIAADSEVSSADSTGTSSETVTKPQNLIVIMNESFADMTMYSGLQFSEDPTPFLHTLTGSDNTISGMMFSPVTGGGTANVEFEYLTGASLSFLPSETVAYQLYMYNGAQSLVSRAAAMGYHTIAFHPYDASGWNRTSVYKWLGFDEQHYEDSVEDPEYIRKYISDSSDYKQIYKWTDETEEPVFLFNVTIQNHSGYSQGWENLSPNVSLTEGGLMEDTQYLSLMHRSDEALKELISHYENSDENTMIVFFGDHQPPLSDHFFRTAYGKSLESRTTQEVMEEYEVPFFIWANYDIPEKQDVKISSNFLGVLTAQEAGFTLSGYESFLSGVMDRLPVITTSGIISSDGQSYQRSTELNAEQQELYRRYSYLSYNYLFDKSGRLTSFY